MKDIDESRPLALAGSLDRSMVWMIALLCIPVVITLSVCIITALRAPAEMKPVFFAALAVAPLAGVLALVFVTRMIGRIGVRLGDGELIVNTGLGRKVFALADLRIHGLRVIDLDRDREVQPFLRVMGTSLPGLRSGRYVLRNREKGICILLGRSRVSYLRSDKDGVSLLLSLAEPEKLQAALERVR